MAFIVHHRPLAYTSDQLRAWLPLKLKSARNNHHCWKYDKRLKRKRITRAFLNSEANDINMNDDLTVLICTATKPPHIPNLSNLPSTWWARLCYLISFYP